MLPADVYARYLRVRGHEVLFICATDEHGTPAELAAREAGIPVEEYCRRMHEVQADLGRRFGLSFDHFGRSSSKENHELTQHFASELASRGLLDEQPIKQIYSVEDQRFLPDRYVIGTCPHCGYTAARGDQCESCTRLLEPTELIGPRSAVPGSFNLEVRETVHLFFRQSGLVEQLRGWLESHKDWPVLASSIGLKWLSEGLRDRCITRDLSWGVPVNRPGFENKVFYVWFDAPIAYIAATKEWAAKDPTQRDWQAWWRTSHEVRYTQFMAKDNVPFHTITFPATILGSGEPWKLVDYIKAFNWLTYYGGKFSTSRHRGVFMNDALDLLPADYWRFFLISHAPESDDADFRWDLFAESVNTNLVGNFGNLVNRILSFAVSRFGPTLPDGGSAGPVEKQLAVHLRERLSAYEQMLEELSYRKALHELRALWDLGNGYLAETEPWKEIKRNQEHAACQVRVAINVIRLLAVVSEPVIPDTCNRVLNALSCDRESRRWPDNVEPELLRLGPGHPIALPGLLFRIITREEVDSWSNRFAGFEETSSSSTGPL